MSDKGPKPSEATLADLPLPADHDVTGGDGKVTATLSQIQELRHETQKAVVNNIRV